MNFEAEKFDIEKPEEKEKIHFPNIEKKFPDGFPKGWRPWIDGWAPRHEELKEKLPDGTYKFLTLDIAINPDDYVNKVNEGLAKELLERKTARELTEEELEGMRERDVEYPICPMGCKHCYAKGGIKIENPLMTKEGVFDILKDAKELGLKSVKFLEPGEMVHNEKLFDILDFFEKNDIKIIIFTKGIIFGDDELAQEIHRISAGELSNKIAQYKNVELVVGYSAFTKEIEEKRIGPRIADFTRKRDRALENLVKAGMNSDINNSRLSIISAPILKDNIDEALPIYKYGLERNMPVILAPTMLSGKGEKMEEIHDEFFKQEQLVNLYRDIYVYLIDNKIFTLEQVEREGITPYAGIPCTQFVSGMFIRGDGQVQACPGNEGESYRYAKDIRQNDLKEVWKNSFGYKLRKEHVENGKDLTTQICYAKTEGDLVQVGSGSIPQNFYEKVLERLREYYKK